MIRHLVEELIGLHVTDAGNAEYADFSEVPWFRRSAVNLSAAVIGLFIPPFLWVVCIVLFTGPVYTPRKDESGNLKKWGQASKWVVLIVAGLQLYRWVRDAM